MKREGHLFRLLTRVWGVPAVDRLQVWGSRYEGGITPLPFRKGGSQARARSLVGSTYPGRTMALDLSGVLGGHASGWGGGIFSYAQGRRACCSLWRRSCTMDVRGKTHILCSGTPGHCGMEYWRGSVPAMPHAHGGQLRLELRGAVGGLQMTSAPDEAHHGLAGSLVPGGSRRRTVPRVGCRLRGERPSDPGRACPCVGARVGPSSRSRLQ